MRFSTIVPVLAAATFVAAQEQIIIGTLNDIADATTTLGDRVTGFTSTLASECALQSAALSLLDVLSQGTTTVSGSRVLTAIESVDLLDPFNALQAQVDTTVNNTIDTKSAFVSANVASVVLAKLNDIKDSASTYADAVVSKVPNESGLPDIARSLAQGILDSIQRGIDAFADQTDGPTSVDCNASTSSSSSAAASASATSTGSASATPPPVSTTLSGTAPIGTGSGLPGHTCTTVTSVVSTLTTFCPGPTTVTYGTNTYTVTEATTLTVTDCPCTITQTLTYPTGPAAPYPTAPSYPTSVSPSSPPAYSPSLTPYDSGAAAVGHRMNLLAGLVAVGVIAVL